MISVWIFYEAYQRFMHPETISSGKMFIVAMGGISSQCFMRLHPEREWP